MARCGRPRQAGERYPSGALKRQADSHNADMMARRALMLGAIVDPRSPLASYPLGILRLRGLIHESEHSAGCRLFEETARSAIAPPPGSQLGKLDGAIRGPYREPDRRDPTPALRDARRVLRRCGPHAAAAVRVVCLDERLPADMQPVGSREVMLTRPGFAALVDGLAALAGHWRY